MDSNVQHIDSSFPLIPSKDVPSDHIPIGCVVSFPSKITTPSLSSTQTSTEAARKE